MSDSLSHTHSVFGQSAATLRVVRKPSIQRMLSLSLMGVCRRLDCFCSFFGDFNQSLAIPFVAEVRTFYFITNLHRHGLLHRPSRPCTNVMSANGNHEGTIKWPPNHSHRFHECRPRQHAKNCSPNITPHSGIYRQTRLVWYEERRPGEADFGRKRD